MIKHHQVLQDLFYDLIDVMQEDENAPPPPSSVPHDVETGAPDPHHAPHATHVLHRQASFGRARIRQHGLVIHDPRADYDMSRSMYSVVDTDDRHHTFKPFALETLGMIVAENVTPDNGLRVFNSRAGFAAGSLLNETASGVDNIVLKMLYCFGKALIEKEKHDTQKHVGLQHLRGDEETKVCDSATELDDITVQVAREEGKEESKCEDAIGNYSSSFIEGHHAAMDLIDVDLTSLLQREDNLAVVVRLANALCMQASLELNMDMKEIANSTMAEKIAYNVGGQIFTYSAIIIQSMAHRV